MCVYICVTYMCACVFSKGRFDESMKYLQRFIAVSEESRDDEAKCQAYSSLASLLNTLVCKIYFIMHHEVY